MMATTGQKRKKEIERRYLEVARRASAIIPEGKIDDSWDEKPDFRIKTATGLLGIEVTELLRCGGGERPVAVQREFEEVVRLAREKNHHEYGASSLGVTVYPSGRETPSKRDRERMARALAEFASSHRSKVSADNPVVYFEDREELPEGFRGLVEINLTGNWVSEEVGGVTSFSEIREGLASRIREKNKLVAEYRKNLPGCPIWLLIYSGFSVARGVPIPYGLSEWTFSFDFEKVLFFSCLDNGEVVVIRKGGSDETTILSSTLNP